MQQSVRDLAIPLDNSRLVGLRNYLILATDANTRLRRHC